jgi:PAS domain S-box-containing protein
MPDDIIREQRAAEDRLNAYSTAGNPFVGVVAKTRMPIVVLDAGLPDYPVIYANAAFLTLTDYAPEEILGSSHRLFTGSATDPGSADRVETALADRRELRLNIFCVRRDGTLFWADVFLSPIQSISGRVLWYLVSYQDISRQRKAEWDAMDWAGLLEQRVIERTKDLVEANRRLSGLLQERDILFREMAHRIRNGLQLACSILMIGKTQISDPEVRDLFNLTQQRIETLNRMHDLLSSDTGLHAVNIGSYLSSVCEALRPLVQDQVFLHCQIALVEWGPDLAIPLGLITNELVTNSIKYGFLGQRTGNIWVGVGETDAGSGFLTVRDDGIGVSLGTDEPAGIGHTLIAALIRSIGGTIEIGPSGDAGYAAVVHFPLSRTEDDGAWGSNSEMVSDPL